MANGQQPPLRPDLTKGGSYVVRLGMARLLDAPAMDQVLDVKHCPYCGRSHERRARACSDWCELKIRGKAAYVTRSRREAVAKIMATLQRRMRHVPKFRQLAMGADPDELLPVIFGTLPTSGEPRHGETLDAP